MRMKYVHTVKTRHGRTVYYFRRNDGERIRLPDNPETPEFFEAYALAMGGSQNSIKSLASKARDKRIISCLESALRGAKSRARDKGKPFDLTLTWAKSLSERQAHKCAVTGIPFFFKTGEQRDRRNPFMPSIDRVDCEKGYTEDNCRIVLYAVDVMLSDWGDKTFRLIAERYIANKPETIAPHHPKKLPPHPVQETEVADVL